MQAIFEKKQEPPQPPLDGRRHVYDSDGGDTATAGAPDTPAAARSSHIREALTKAPADDSAWISSGNGDAGLSSSEEKPSTEGVVKNSSDKPPSATASSAAATADPEEVLDGSCRGLSVCASSPRPPESASGEARESALHDLNSSGAKDKNGQEAAVPSHAEHGTQVLHEVRRRETISKEAFDSEVDVVSESGTSGGERDKGLQIEDSQEIQTKHLSDASADSSAQSHPCASEEGMSKEWDRASPVPPGVSVGIVRKTLEALREGGGMLDLPPAKDAKKSDATRPHLNRRRSMDDRSAGSEVFSGCSVSSVPRVHAVEEKAVSGKQSPVDRSSLRGKSLNRDEALRLAVDERVGVDNAAHGLVPGGRADERAGAADDDLSVIEESEGGFPRETDEAGTSTHSGHPAAGLPTSGAVEETVAMDQETVLPLRSPGGKPSSAGVCLSQEASALSVAVSRSQGFVAGEVGDRTSAARREVAACERGRSPTEVTPSIDTSGVDVDVPVMAGSSPVAVSSGSPASTKSPDSTKSLSSPPALMEKLSLSRDPDDLSAGSNDERLARLSVGPEVDSTEKGKTRVEHAAGVALTRVVRGFEDRLPRASVAGGEDLSRIFLEGVNRTGRASHEGTLIVSKSIAELPPVEVPEKIRGTPCGGAKHEGVEQRSYAEIREGWRRMSPARSPARGIAGSTEGNPGVKTPGAEKTGELGILSPPWRRVCSKDVTPPTTACTTPQKVRESRRGRRESAGKDNRGSPGTCPGSTEGSRPGKVHADDADATSADGAGKKSLPPIAKRAGLRAAREGWGIMPAISPFSGRSTLSPPRSSFSPKTSVNDSPNAFREFSPRRRSSMSPGPRSTTSVFRRRETLSPSWQVTASALSPLRWARALSPRHTGVEEEDEIPVTPPSVSASTKSILWVSASASTPEAPVGDGDDMYDDTFSPLSDDVEENSVGGGEVSFGGTDEEQAEEQAEEKRVVLVDCLARELPEFVATAVGLVGSVRTLVACQMVNRSWHEVLGGKRGRTLFGSTVRASGIPDRLRPALWQALVMQAVGGKRGEGGSGGGILGTGEGHV